MAGWGGFTEEDLLALKQDQEIPRTSPDVQDSKLSFKGKGRPATSLEGSLRSKKKPKERALRSFSGKQATVHDSSIHQTERQGKGYAGNAPSVISNTDQYQSGTKRNNEQGERMIQPDVKSLNMNEDNHMSSSDDKSSETQGTDEKEENKLSKEETSKDVNIVIVPEKEVAALELSHLEQLQQKQKLVEEENKKRKKIIKDAIQERYSKAQSEAQVLKAVQKELNHLDQILAKDVEILRTKIEEATTAYSHAQKRYQKAEEEFVQAKLDVHLKEEIKDQLTQHLYTIIQENELRKARKLEELMSKLNLSQENSNEHISNDISETIVDDKHHSSNDVSIEASKNSVEEKC